MQWVMAVYGQLKFTHVFTLTRMEAAATTNMILIIKCHETRSTTQHKTKASNTSPLKDQPPRNIKYVVDKDKFTLTKMEEAAMANVIPIKTILCFFDKWHKSVIQWFII